MNPLNKKEKSKRKSKKKNKRRKRKIKKGKEGTMFTGCFNWKKKLEKFSRYVRGSAFTRQGYASVTEVREK